MRSWEWEGCKDPGASVWRSFEVSLVSWVRVRDCWADCFKSEVDIGLRGLFRRLVFTLAAGGGAAGTSIVLYLF